MEPRTLLDARTGPCLVVDLLGGARGHGLMGFGAGEEPGLGTLDLPIGTQCKKQTLGKLIVIDAKLLID